jgi:hypothetical protein
MKFFSFKKKTKDSEPHTKRPASVTLIAWLSLIDMFITILIGLLGIWIMLPQVARLIPISASPVLQEMADWLEVPQTETGTLTAQELQPIIEAVFDIVTGILGLYFTLNFLRLKPWGWTWLMLYNGVVLIILFGDCIRGEPDYVSLFLSALVILLMNQKEVRIAFKIDKKYASTNLIISKNS